MTHASLFTGIGGFDLAAQWMGWENLFQCEIDAWCSAQLEKNFPYVQRYTDIRQFDAAQWHGRVDVLSGGFPCQPFSVAGKRLGTADERHLWPEMLRVIQQIAPRYVVAENVRGLLNWSGGLVFEQVQTDLEAAGYETIPFILPAASANAPHRRDRIWIIAHTRSPRTRSEPPTPRDERRPAHEVGRESIRPAYGQTGPTGTHTASAPHPHTNRQRQPQPQGTKPQERRRTGDLGQTNAAYTESKCKRKQANETYSIPKKWETRDEFGGNRTSPPNADHQRCRQLHIAPQPERSGLHSGSLHDCWDEWTTEPPVCRVDDGIPHRVDRIRGLGNAIVPQIAYRIFLAIQHTDIVHPS